jgi:muconolactone delta-isomerase
MIVLARGSITKPDALAPYISDEMRVVEELKAEGIMKALYRRAAGPGVYLLLEGSSIDAIRDRVDTLPFVVEGLMTLDYDEI